MNTNRLLVVIISLACCLSVQSTSVASNARPNVLWIIAEDMSQDLGCYGNELVNTPNIDKLARGGMRFDRVFTTGPACSPSRTALATGVYQTTLGAYHMRYSDELLPVLSRPYKILPELMRENGYYSGNIVDFGRTGTGKDDWLFQTTQKSWDTDTWDDLPDNQPFFAQINFSESHRTFARKSKHPVDADKISIPPYYPDHSASREDWAGYLREVNVADEHVGDILEKLKEDGLAENTIVIFLSDHGRPMIRAKNWLYDSGTLIPLVIHYPENVDTPSGFSIGGSNSELISGVDLVAETLLMTGAEIPGWMQGRSFLRDDSRRREYLYTAVDRIGDIDSQSRAVRTQRFKYIRNFKIPGSVNESTTQYRRATHPIYHLLNIMSEKGQLTPVQAQLLKPIAGEELYDLENDPFEITNLVGNSKFEATRKRLEHNLSDWIESSGDRGFEEDSDAIMEHFKAYGISTAKQQKESIAKRHASVGAYFE